MTSKSQGFGLNPTRPKQGLQRGKKVVTGKLQPLRNQRGVLFESIMSFRPAVNQAIVEEASKFGRRLSITSEGKETARFWLMSLGTQRKLARESLEALRSDFMRETGLKIDFNKIDAKWIEKHRRGLKAEAKRWWHPEGMHPQAVGGLQLLDIVEQRLKDIKEVNQAIAKIKKKVA